MKDKTKDALVKIAQEKCWSDSPESKEDGFVDVQSFSGGNFDDAYQGGIVEGQIHLARMIADMEGIEY